MRKNLMKKLSTVLLSAAILCSTSIQTLASTNTSKDINSITKPTTQLTSTLTSSTSQLIDGQTISETLPGGKYYDINVQDTSDRQILITSNKPIKAILTCPNLGSLVNFDSGYFFYVVKINWNFIAGMDYKLLVVPQESDASVNLTMSKQSDTSWIYVSTYTHETQQLIWGQHTDTFNYRFLVGGYYKISVNTNCSALSASLTSVFGDNQNAVFGNTTRDFYINASATSNMADYALKLQNIGDGVNNGSHYTITIQKIY